MPKISAATFPLITEQSPFVLTLTLEEAANFGLLQGMTTQDKFGRNNNVTSAEDIWNGGDDYTGQPDDFTPEPVTVVSDDTDDTADGTGARTLELFGLESPTSTEYTTETVAMNGTTPVESTKSWWRVPRQRILTAGSTGGNAGTITIASKTTTANVFSVLAPGLNRSTIAAITVPYGKVGVIGELDIYGTRTSGTGFSVITLRARQPGGVYEANRIYTVSDRVAVQKQYKAYQQFPAGTDIKVRCESVSSGTFDISAEFSAAFMDATA